MSDTRALRLAEKLISIAKDLEEQTSTARHEAGLAKANLLEICGLSQELNNLIKPEQELDAWVAEKISTAYNCLHSVHRFLKHEGVIKSGDMHNHTHMEPEHDMDAVEEDTMEDMSLIDNKSSKKK